MEGLHLRRNHEGVPSVNWSMPDYTRGGYVFKKKLYHQIMELEKEGFDTSIIIDLFSYHPDNEDPQKYEFNSNMREVFDVVKIREYLDHELLRNHIHNAEDYWWCDLELTYHDIHKG